MKTYKAYYHNQEIIFESDSVKVEETKVLFYKNNNLIAAIPHSCPYTVIGIKPNDNEK